MEIFNKSIDGGNVGDTLIQHKRCFTYYVHKNQCKTKRKRFLVLLHSGSTLNAFRKTIVSE